MHTVACLHVFSSKVHIQHKRHLKPPSLFIVGCHSCLTRTSSLHRIGTFAPLLLCYTSLLCSCRCCCANTLCCLLLCLQQVWVQPWQRCCCGRPQHCCHCEQDCCCHHPCSWHRGHCCHGHHLCCHKVGAAIASVWQHSMLHLWQFINTQAQVVV